MFADPAAHLGDPHRQEYAQGVAEDMAEVLSVTESITAPYGSFDNVLETKDYTPLEPDLLENKFYAQGIGVVKETDINTGEEVLLVEFTQP